MNRAEQRFHSWLDHLNVAHIFIYPQRASFAAAFSGVTKRPDFIVFPEGGAPYSVDVKEKRLEQRPEYSSPTFEIDRYCAKTLRAFQTLYNVRVWLALTPDSTKDEWYFIDVYHLAKLPRQFRPAGSNYCYVPYTGQSANSAYLCTEHSWRPVAADKGFFLRYLTKNSPRFTTPKNASAMRQTRRTIK